jgi:uncharacterized Zn finger protein
VTRETAAEKARRYLAEGRLTVLEVGPAVIRATCAGDGQVYRCGWWQGEWGCTCPNLRDQCSHLKALRLVTQRPDDAEAGPLTPARLRAEQAEAARVRNGSRRPA